MQPKSNVPFLVRHGDVLVQRVAKLPPDIKEQPGFVLAYGESTGHAHRVEAVGSDAQLFRSADERFVVVSGPATLRHEEHGPIPLPPGMYRYWIQREYVPTGKGQTVDFVPVRD